jgi:SAM-dependent methyltransferase
MLRLNQLKKYVSKDARGIEIAPYFNPVVSKKSGYNVLIVDVFDEEVLRKRALADPNIPDDRVDEIEKVDIVCDASRLGSFISEKNVAEQFQYIISSHNFEHLPDPIRFLQSAYMALAPGGVLSMAIPDYRACFDHFRMPTRLIDWLAAYHREYRLPSPEMHFDSAASISTYLRSGQQLVGCDINSDDPSQFRLLGDVSEAYQNYLKDLRENDIYKDVHCTALFGSIFELYILDLNYIGLINFETLEVTPTYGLEFFAHLRKPVDISAVNQPELMYFEKRSKLLIDINSSLGRCGFSKHNKDIITSNEKSKNDKRFGLKLLNSFKKRKIWLRNAILRRL